MLIFIILLTGRTMELEVDRSRLVEEVLIEIVDRMYVSRQIGGVATSNYYINKFRLVARVGTTCETMLKNCRTMAFYNTRGGNVFNLIYLPDRPFSLTLFSEWSFSESEPGSVVVALAASARSANELYEGSRPRSRSRSRARPRPEPVELQE